jgi:membrane protein implicated in regulation of membrane protease activity
MHVLARTLGLVIGAAACGAGTLIAVIWLLYLLIWLSEYPPLGQLWQATGSVEVRLVMWAVLSVAYLFLLQRVYGRRAKSAL